MPNEGIDVASLKNRIEWLTKDCEDYKNKLSVLSDLFGELSHEYNNCRRRLEVSNKNNERKLNLIMEIQDFYKENDRMSKKQFIELLNAYL